MTYADIRIYGASVARAATTADTFNAVGELQRRRILELLAGGEAAVGENVEAVGLTPPQVSKHLAVLRSVDLVRNSSVGRRRYYRVNVKALEPIHDWLESFAAHWDERFDRFEAVLTELKNEKENNGP